MEINDLIFSIQKSSNNLSHNLKILRELTTDYPSSEELVLEIQKQNDKKNNLEKLYIVNLWMIAGMAKRFKGADYQSLVQVGYIGLVEASEAYSFNHSTNFATYARHWIRSEMIYHLKANGGVISIPSNLKTKLLKYKRIVAEHEADNTDVDDKEMLYQLNLSEKEYALLNKALDVLCVCSLDSTIETEEGTIAAIDSISDGCDFEEEAISNLFNDQLAGELWPIVDELEKPKADVIRQIYRDGKSLSDVARNQKVSVTTVSQRKESALKELRKKDKLWQYYFELYGDALAGSNLSAFRRSGTSATEREAIKLIEQLQMDRQPYR